MRRCKKAEAATRCVAVLGGMLALAACSSFTGIKVQDSMGGSAKADGVQYTLVRGEFYMSRAAPPEGQKKPVYTLTAKYEPDPGQRFSLKLDPGMFTNPSFVMKLSPSGTLVGTTGTVADQIGPTITALGSFAKDILTASATGILFDKSSVRNQIALLMDEKACLLPTDAPRMPSLPDSETVGKYMILRMNAFKDDDEFKELFHYATKKERACLEHARARIDEKAKEEDRRARQSWEDALKAHKASQPADAAFVDRLTAAVETESSEELQKIKAEIAAENVKATADRQAAKTDAERRAAQSQADLIEARRILYVPAGRASKAFTTGRALEVLTLLIDMKDAAWRARHVLFLEREIAQASLKRIREPEPARVIAPLPPPSPDAEQHTPRQPPQVAHRDSPLEVYLARLALLRAEALDAREPYERSLNLADFIKRLTYKRVEGGIAPATTEYATARAELDAALAQVEARRARVMADAAPAAPGKVAVLSDERVITVTQGTIEESKKPGWISGSGANAEQFVIVLEELK